MPDALRADRARWLSLLAAAACLLGAWYALDTHGDEASLKRANADARAGNYAGAVQEARKVTGGPVAARARTTEAYALLYAKRYAESAKTFARAAELAPNDWSIRRGYAFALLGAGHRDAAALQLARASALNPRLALPPGFQG